jgi:hypothetical protein
VTPHVSASRLLLAVSVSLLIHGSLMSGSWLQAPQMKSRESPLQVSLLDAPPQPPPPVAVKPTPRVRTAPQRSLSRRTPGTPSAVPATSHVAPEPQSADYEEERSELPAPEPAPTEVAAALPEPLPERAPIRTLPRKGRIAYTMYIGEGGFTVGKTVQTWEVYDDGYKLGSVSETSGIVELFRAQRHIYLSEGRFTGHGLQPEKFFMSRTRRGRTEAAQALFDWESGVITLGRVPHQRGAALFPQAQDIVSFMYHLALSPPAPGRIRLPVTNGSRFETYELDVLDEERIETPLGVLRALPVKQVPRPGAESIAVWLAVDYRHLPVRLRFFDRDGRQTAEQVVDQIQISDE